jgi:hypothetical protein
MRSPLAKIRKTGGVYLSYEHEATITSDINVYLACDVQKQYLP